MLYLAWRYGGADPYRTYHSLDEDYRPVGGGDPLPPSFPSRVKALVYGFGVHAEQEEAQKFRALAGRGMG